MSAEHKAALAKGREEGRAVRRYLLALEEQRPRRGRKRTPESIRRRLDAVDKQLVGADPLARLHLLQEREDLSAELARKDASDDLVAAERAFVMVAGAYGRRKGIGYGAWRAVGVSVSVLEKAGISRSDRS
ncbi:MAG: hypothetical protein ACLP6E_09095 [Acidimicrobiales bacterium]